MCSIPAPEKTQPLAVIGFAAKYSQEASDVESFWDFLVKARQSSTPFPKDRLNIDGYYHPDAERAGTIHAKGGHFFSENPHAFDAAFFNVSKTEAMSVDPQQRLVMENVYHALENAGIQMQKAVSSNTSVFVTGFNHDYSDQLNTDLEVALKHRPTGSEGSMISGRVSWFYNFKGPSITVDTACSSSMVAFHLANQSIKSGDSNMAIISGVNVFGAWNHVIGMSHAGVLSAEGRCFTFDHRADGYARGEGVGTVIIKLLDKAIADGDTIRAVVRATALNHDGRTPGLTHPSGDAQANLIKTAYDLAGLDPTDTLYIESHGTGTPTGDPIEVRSIARAFKTESREQPIHVGALKPNIGHIEGGSGISGIIKAILVLESGIIPANVNFEKPNPQIHNDQWNVRFPIKTIPWPGSCVRRASVNCFGLSGTNAHCILDDAYNYMKHRGLNGLHNTRQTVPTKNEVEEMTSYSETDDRFLSAANEDTGPEVTAAPKILLLSGFDQDAPARFYKSLIDYTAKYHNTVIDDIAYTLSERRSKFRWNSYVLSNTTKDLATQVGSGRELLSPISAQRPPNIGYVFTGQGVQYAGMGKQLLQFPVFRKSLDAASEYMRKFGAQWWLVDEIMKDASNTRIDESEISHPACTAIQVGLVDLLSSWNIHPSSVVGHSSGEIAAAYCAGKISREAAWNVSYQRGLVTSQMASEKKGAMLAVGIDAATLQCLVDETCQSMNGEVVIACFNSPKNNTVSGDEPLIVAIQDVLQIRDIFCRRLRTPKAYHSPHMNEIADDYLEAMNEAHEDTHVAHDQSIRFFSTSTGGEIKDDNIHNDYWVNNMITTVKLAKAIQSMCSNQENDVIDELVEIGPHPALQSAVKETLAGNKSILYSATLKRNETTANDLLNTIGALVSRGVCVDLNEVNFARESIIRRPRLLVNLPCYHFNRKEPRHDLLGVLNPDSNPLRWSWRHFLRVRENPWLSDHKIARNIVFPGAGYLTMAIEAARQTMIKKPMDGFHIRDVSFKAMLVIPDTQEGVETCFSMLPAEESNISTSTYWSRFVASSYNFELDEWTENCSGYIATVPKNGPNTVTNDWETLLAMQDSTKYQEQSQQCQRTLDFDKIYDNLESIGINFGRNFRNIHQVKIHGHGVMSGKITIPSIDAGMPKKYTHDHLIHPTTLDAALQAGIAAICDYTGKDVLNRGIVPNFINYLQISLSMPDQGIIGCRGKVSLVSNDTYKFDSRLWDERTKDPVISISGINLAPFQPKTGSNAGEKEVFYQISWGPDANLLDSSNLPSSTPDKGHYKAEMVWFREIQLAAALLAKDALVELSPDGLPVTAQDHHRKFYSLLKKIVSDASAGSVSGIEASEWNIHNSDKTLRNLLYERVAKRELNGDLLIRMGSQTASFIQQKSDPLYPMFGQDDIMTRYYDMDMEMGPIPEKFTALMKSVRHTSSNMRILEVGAGTGGFAARVLSSLSPEDELNKGKCIASYDFTDISASFFEKAKNRLADWSNILQYRRLDISKDPIKQGFAETSYDMIVASNVLHATSSIGNTLQNLHSLLRPGGKLLFLEGVRQDTLYSNMSFSALPGWWLGKEPIRKWCPYISTEQWDGLLRCSKFSGVEINIPSSYYPEFNKIAIMLSTAMHVPGSVDKRNILIITPQLLEKSFCGALKSHIQGQFKSSNCQVISLHELKSVNLREAICVSLLELWEPVLAHPDENVFNDIRHFMTACNRVLWITGMEDPRFEMATGLIRTIRWERDTEHLNLVTLSINTTSSSEKSSIKTITKIISLQFLDFGDSHQYKNAEYKFNGMEIQTSRVVENIDATSIISSRFCEPEPESLHWKDINRPVKLNIAKLGSFEKLHWVTDVDVSQSLADTEVEIQVEAVGMNFRDLLAVMGEFPQTYIGEEAAGVVTRVGSSVTRCHKGDRVAFFSDPNHAGTFRSLGRADQGLVVRVPIEFGMTQAASMLSIYATVIYSLKNIAGLKPDDSVLIHAGAGGVGQAAIQYARSVGSEIFTTVSSLKKKELIMNKYGIPEDHIFSSRDLNFAVRLKSLLPGGVDVILNSLSGEALHKSWNCIAPFGRFIEIGKRDIHSGGKLDMRSFSKNVIFASIDLLTVARQRLNLMTAILDEVIELWTKGIIHEPSPVNLLSFAEIKNGLQALQLGQNIGKIVHVPGKEEVSVVPDLLPSDDLDCNASFILAGGLGGLGRSIARWMASRGAKCLIFFSRSQKLSTAVQDIITDLNGMGCQPHVYTCDISNEAQLRSTMKQIQEKRLPPIRGCINLSADWADSTFEKMSSEQWSKMIRPKVWGSWNLHEVLLAEDLEFFVMLSSVASVIGNRSQANYSAGNVFQGALARYRVSKGVHAVSIDLGVVDSVGFMAEHKEYTKHSMKIAHHHNEDQMLAIIEYAISQRRTSTKSTCQLVCGLLTRSAYEKKGIPPPSHTRYPMFVHLQDNMCENAIQNENMDDYYHAEALLVEAQTKEQATLIVCRSIHKKLSSMLGVTESDIDSSLSMRENGVDSLTEIEFQTWVTKDLGATITKGDIFTMSLTDLSAKIAGLSTFVSFRF